MTSVEPGLLFSLEGPDLADAAEEFAISTERGDLQQLLVAMQDPSFLDRLDPQDAYEGQPMSLELARLLKALADNAEPNAHALLVALTKSTTLTSRWQCNELLIRALTEFRPAAADTVAFWRALSQPRALHRHSAVAAICQNASAPAMPVLHDNLANPNHESQERIAWMRDAVLQNRNEPEILDTCQTLLAESLEPQLHPFLVESLFDYQPLEWYRACSPPSPPEAEDWTPVARQKCLALAKFIVANLTLRPGLKDIVQQYVDASTDQ